MDDEDYSHTQAALLDKQLKNIPCAPRQPQSLTELLYTASETGIIDTGVSEEDALMIWKLVELARALGDTCPQELRM